MNEHEATRDEELIKAHLQGAEHAFRALVEHHAPDLASTLERMVRDYHLALDLAQEVFVKVYRLLPSYTFKGRFRSMLYTIALNHARDALRKKRRAPVVFLDESRSRALPDKGSDSDDAQDMKRRIEFALDQIPSPYHEAVYLRDVAGLSYAEVGEALGCSLGTVKSRVNRGRLHFRNAYMAEMQGKERKGKHNAS